MTTDNENVTDDVIITPPKRELGILLSLGTYQGMTDEEIEDIIEFRCTQARQDDLQKMRYNNLEVQNTAILQSASESARLANELLQSVLATGGRIDESIMEKFGGEVSNG
jgi:hypothetical protein